LRLAGKGAKADQQRRNEYFFHIIRVIFRKQR
jgi:hypothetical protein